MLYRYETLLPQVRVFFSCKINGYYTAGLGPVMGRMPYYHEANFLASSQ